MTAPEQTQRFFEQQTALLTRVEQMQGRQMELAEAMIARLALPPPVAVGGGVAIIDGGGGSCTREIQSSQDMTGTQPTFYLGE